ncbi:uncharacterized protein BYT42DRAFT_145557 [Radiomyces spectabilis]|uniref:uncharacterized protein n=1 Tax=Radiomyces spectabilis TaxID=64574 RepID=UPI00221F3D7B|nr:uncharacterized protein BYT42DRAFT_145557 [Radiomyces spectabilis]KAI8365915.1 hypothetical protein BYT42DRAFT_145557 [Radiomyces spectabilis]
MSNIPPLHFPSHASDNAVSELCASPNRHQLLDRTKPCADHDVEQYLQQKVNRTRNPCPKWLNPSLLDACQTVIFASMSVQQVVQRSLRCIVNDQLVAEFAPLLRESKITAEKLVLVLEQTDPYPSLSDLCKVAVTCIKTQKELCKMLKMRSSTIIKELDGKFARHLLLNIHGAMIDFKDAWTIIVSSLSLPSAAAATALQQTSSPNTPSYFPSISDPSVNMQSTSSTPTSSNPGTVGIASAPFYQSVAQGRSQNEFSHFPTMSPLSSPASTEDNSQLYSHIKLAVTGSFHVVELLRQSIDEALSTKISASLEKRLHELLQVIDYAAEMTQALDKSLEALICKENAQVVSQSPLLLNLQNRKETSRKFWEDTNIYFKAIVALMSSVRSISTEEDFTWTKFVKQGCLQVTRVTADVAKLWNSYSTFAEDGFFLGKVDDKGIQRSMSGSEVSTPTASAIGLSPSTLLSETSSSQRQNTNHSV